jgi:hypothetical protein
MTVHRITGSMSDLCALCTYRHVTFFFFFLNSQVHKIAQEVCHGVTGEMIHHSTMAHFPNHDTHLRVITGNV